MLSLYTVVMNCESVYSGCIKPNDHIYKALLERLTSDKFQWHFIQEFFVGIITFIIFSCSHKAKMMFNL